MPEESNFQQPTLSEGKVVALRSNPFNNTILPVQIAQNTNLSDIFPFEFEANKSLFLLSNIAVNEQKAITAIESAGSIITYQLMQQLNRNIDRQVQTVIITADDMKKTPVGEIDNFPFTIDEITISVKVLVMDTLQYQAFIRNDWFSRPIQKKVPVFEFEEKKEMPLTETYMALGSTSNQAEKTEQEIFEESREWKKVRCKDCKKKLSSIGACIFLEEVYETHTYYFCKACYRERFGYPKRSEKWDNTPCLIFRRETLFDVAYNSAFNKLYHYLHDVEIIFDLAMALINRAAQENVYQMKKAEYIEYTIELAGFDYEDKVETYHQITSYTYPTKKAQIQ
ncbi:hypothetical protein G9A89_018771 [Geosiphon pyriformis]|nr:hypothetical protein G9A89_018771 [Geosiphon pyriformis]